MSMQSDVFIATTDAQALSRLLSEPIHRDDPDDSTLELSAKLLDARIVRPRALPYGSVRLYSTVIYEELPDRVRRRVTLVNPREADASAGRISILSPLGRALLGHATGRALDVMLPTGRRLRIRVVDVLPVENEENERVGRLAEA